MSHLALILLSFAARSRPIRRHPLECRAKHQRLQCMLEEMDKSKLFVATFELPTLGDLDRFGRLVPHAFWHILNLLDHIITFQDFTKDNMLAVQPASNGRRNEELVSSLARVTVFDRAPSYLRAIGVLARIGHAQ